MKDQKTKMQFIDLRAQGMSYDKIARELEVSKQTLINWSKEYEIEIANLKAIEMESLQERYYLNKSKRIELLGKKLAAVQDELENRDLKDVPTDKLFDLFIKYTNALKKEEVGIVFQQVDGLLPALQTQVSSWNG